MCVICFQDAAAQATVGDERYGTPEALASLIADNDAFYILIDVRTPEEYSAGHIPTALNMPSDSIAYHIPEDYRDGLIVVYCDTGERSSSARKTLESLGFHSVVDFGSISKWTGDLNKTDLPGLCPCSLRH
jgi:phage shock protein E